MTPDERREHHISLRQRMLAGDNEARWSLAMECVPVMMALYARKNRANVHHDRLMARMDGMRSDAALIAYDAVPSWKPELGGLSLLASLYVYKLAVSEYRMEGPVSRSAYDYEQRRTLYAVRASDSDEGMAYEAALGSAPQHDTLRLDVGMLAAKAKLSDRETDLLSRNLSGETMDSWARAHGVCQARAQQIHSRALAKMREIAHASP